MFNNHILYYNESIIQTNKREGKAEAGTRERLHTVTALSISQVRAPTTQALGRMVAGGDDSAS